MRTIFPPRPRSLIPPGQLLSLEKQGRWIAQRKFGGHRILVHVRPDGYIELFGRHGRPYPQTRYAPTSSLRQQFRSLQLENGKEYWLDGELLHPRVPGTIALFDVLHFGEYLFGVNQIDRLELLRKICRDPQDDRPKIALAATSNIWMAEYWREDLRLRYSESLNYGLLVEGLMLRDSTSSLDDWGHRPYEVDWQVRCRKPSKSYAM